MKTDPLAVAAPKFVLVPLIYALPRNGSAPPVRHVEQPHSIWQPAVLMTEQNKIAVPRVDMDVIDPEFIFAKYFFCLSCGCLHAHDGAGRLLEELLVGEFLSGIGALRAFHEQILVPGGEDECFPAGLEHRRSPVGGQAQ